MDEFVTPHYAYFAMVNSVADESANGTSGHDSLSVNTFSASTQMGPWNRGFGPPGPPRGPGRPGPGPPPGPGGPPLALPLARFSFVDNEEDWNRNARSRSDNFTAFSMNAAFAEIIQFNDGDGDGKFTTGGADAVISRYELGSSPGWGGGGHGAGARTYSDFSLSQAPNGNGTVYSLTTHTEDGVFEMQYLLSTQRGYDSRTQSYLSPSGLKLNIVLDGFPYAEPPVSNASDFASPYNLALKIFVATDAAHGGGFQFHARSDELDPRLAAAGEGGGAEQAFFSWSETVSADGRDYRMQTSVDVDGPHGGIAFEHDMSVAAIYFTLANSSRPQRVVWDPMLGSAVQTSSGGGSGDGVPVGVLSAVGLAAVVAASVAVMRRRRRNAASTSGSADGGSDGTTDAAAPYRSTGSGTLASTAGTPAAVSV